MVQSHDSVVDDTSVRFHLYWCENGFTVPHLGTLTHVEYSWSSVHIFTYTSAMYDVELVDGMLV